MSQCKVEDLKCCGNCDNWKSARMINYVSCDKHGEQFINAVCDDWEHDNANYDDRKCNFDGGQNI